MDERRFDVFVKIMTEGPASRRLVAKGLLATVAAGVPAAGNVLDALAGRHHKRKKRRKPLRCSGDSCDGTGGKRCGGRDDCQCYRAAQGGHVCVSSLQSSCDATCGTDNDCPRGRVCVEGGPACCGNGVRFCKKACTR